MPTYPEVKTDIVNGVTETDGNQVNDIEDYLGIVGDPDPDTITHKLTNPESIGPGHKHPVADLDGGSDGTICYKDPADSIWKAWLPDTIGLVTKGDEQNITAKKTFTVLPEANVTPTSDNQLARKKYVDDLMILPKYGGMYRYNFSEIDPPIYWGYRQGLLGFTAQVTDGVTFYAGSTGVITGITDAGNSYARIESMGHGLSNGDVITINGTLNYNRYWTVRYFDSDFFDIFVTFFSAGTLTDFPMWCKPSSLKINTGGAGIYKVHFSALLNIMEANIDPNDVELFVNESSKEELYLRFMTYQAESPFEMGVSRTSLLTLADNDVLWISQLNRSQTVSLRMPCADLVLNRIDV